MLLALRRWLGLGAPAASRTRTPGRSEGAEVGDRAGARRAHCARRGAVAVPAHPVVLRLAPDQRTLRGQDARPVLDVFPAAGADPDQHVHLRQHAAGAVRRHAVFPVHPHRDVVLAHLRPRRAARDAQPGPEPRAHQEGLFPPAHRADLLGGACAHRVRRAVHAADPHLRVLLREGRRVLSASGAADPGGVRSRW